MRYATAWSDLIGNLPQQTTRLLGQLERGELKVQLHLTDLHRATGRLDRIANRVILSMLLAAFIVALALLIPTLDLTWPWGLLTWIIVLSFMVMSILAIWLIWSIFRSGRL
jgi:ubiquinone biosynthesis protein